MVNDSFILVAIISAWLLIVFIISDFLERFDKKSRKQIQTLNYGLKGLLYLFAVFVWMYSIWIRKKIEMVDLILIFMFFLELISYLKLKKNIIFKNRLKWFLTCFMGVIVIGSPFIVKYFTEKDCWIDFWGGYLGAIIGGVITLYVMWKTNKEARNNLEISLQSDKQAEKRKEKREFCNWLIEKYSVWLGSIEDMMTEASRYSAFEEKFSQLPRKTNEEAMQNIEYLIVFAKQLREVKAINYELYLHFQVKIKKVDYFPDKAEELYALFEKMHDSLEAFSKEIHDVEVLKIYYGLFQTIISGVNTAINQYIEELLRDD